MAIAGPSADLAGIRSFYIVGSIGLAAAAILRTFIPSIMHIEEEAS